MQTRKAVSFFLILLFIGTPFFLFIPSVHATNVNFGNETKYASTHNDFDYIFSTHATATGGNGTLTSITFYLAQYGAATPKIKYAIYFHSNNSLLAVTEEWTLTSSWDGWKTLSTTTSPTIYNGTVYYLSSWSSDSVTRYFQAGESTPLGYLTYTGTYPDPMNTVGGTLSEDCSAYGTYTVEGGGGPTNMSFSFSETVNKTSSSSMSRGILTPFFDNFENGNGSWVSTPYAEPTPNLTTTWYYSPTHSAQILDYTGSGPTSMMNTTTNSKPDANVYVYCRTRWDTFNISSGQTNVGSSPFELRNTGDNVVGFPFIYTNNSGSNWYWALQWFNMTPPHSGPHWNNYTSVSVSANTNYFVVMEYIHNASYVTLYLWIDNNLIASLVDIPANYIYTADTVYCGGVKVDSAWLVSYHYDDDIGWSYAYPSSSVNLLFSLSETLLKTVTASLSTGLAFSFLGTVSKSASNVMIAQFTGIVNLFFSITETLAKTATPTIQTAYSFLNLETLVKTGSGTGAYALLFNILDAVAKTGASIATFETGALNVIFTITETLSKLGTLIFTPPTITPSVESNPTFVLAAFAVVMSIIALSFGLVRRRRDDED